ncbi:MAG: zinc-dependent metalloprotease [Phaeodactylibacter sp.]|nr:zinc-dependent metalloprotease [Phaeodactylibacter sp.]MCB9273318.1 hypothetical protein [Lewinellaceae bacterium]
MRLFLLLLISLIAVFPGPLSAQKSDRGCGTVPERNEWLVAFQQNPAAFPRSPKTLYVPLAVHIVGTDDGKGYLQAYRVLDAFCTLNQDYEAANIQFYLSGTFHYINSSKYFEHDYNKGIEMMQAYNRPDAVNCYIVGDPAGNCGYAFYTLGIALDKSCLSETEHTWAHELGHYFSLPHTFYGWEGYDFDYSQAAPATVNGRPVELADGSNCAYAGDGFCDTPADYLNFRWSCQGNGLSPQQQKDPAGRTFRSDGTLLMSYAMGDCANRFSDSQIDALRANLEGPRSALLNDDAPLPPLGSPPARPINPEQDQLITNVSSLSLEWPPVPNAEGYIVQLNLLSPLGEETPFMYYQTEEPGIEIDGLLSERSWRWRVRPYNSYESCAGFSEAFSFDTGNFISNTKEQASLSEFRVHPNPLSSGASMKVEFELPYAFNLQLTLYTSAGVPARRQLLDAHYGHNEATLNTTGLPAGLYWLGIEHTGGRKFQKIIVQ